MKSFFFRLFNLYPGEARNAFLFALLAFCWSLASNLGFKFSDALLLIHVGAKALPTIYIISACGMIIPAILLLNIINTVGPSKIFVGVIITAMAFYSLIFSFITSGMGTESGWLWYLLRIVSFQIDALLISSYWTFIDRYHNMQDSKRTYVLFSLTVFCGQAVTGFIMQSGVLEFKYILLIIFCLLVASLYLTRKITTTVHLAHDQGVLDEEEATTRMTFSQTIRNIAKSPFTIILMVNNFVIFLMWVTAEYNYLSFFDQHFDPPGHSMVQGGAKSAAITLFLGKLLATVSFTNLIFGLFLYSRLIRRFGVVSLLFFSPVILIVAMSGWLTYPAVIFPIMAYFVVEGFLEVVDESNFSLLLNAVPKKLKYRVRILIESFLEPLAMMCSGLMLTVTLQHTLALCLALAITAFALAMVLRKAYRVAVYRNLAKNAIHFEKSPVEWFGGMNEKQRENETNELFSILTQSKSVDDQLFAANSILSLCDVSLIPRLITISKNLSPQYQVPFLKALGASAFSMEKFVADHLFEWLSDLSNENVQASIQYILAKQGLLHPENIHQYLDSTNPILKSTAIITYKQSWEHLTPSAVLQNRKVADQHLQEMLDSPDEDDICLALKLLGEESSQHHYPLLLSFLNHPSQRVRRQAMDSFAKIATPQCRQYAKLLISHLRRSNDAIFRRSCLNALGKLDDATLIRDMIAASKHFHQNERRITVRIIRKMGHSAIPKLLAATKDTALPECCRALAGRILGYQALPYLHANLHEIISVEIERAYFYYYHYHTVQEKNPEHDLTLLVEALHASYHAVIDFIIQMLSTAGEVEDCDLISRLFRSHSSKVRSQVVEMLEKTCDPKIFKLLRPLLEDVPPREILGRHLAKKNLDLPLPSLLERLLHTSSHVDLIVAVTLMKDLKLPHWKDALMKLLSSNEPIFRHFAKELINS